MPAVRPSASPHVANHARVGPGEARRHREEPGPAVAVGADEACGGNPALLDGGAGLGLCYGPDVAHTTRIGDKRPATHVPPWRGRGRRPQRERRVEGAPEAHTVLGMASASTDGTGRPPATPDVRPRDSGSACSATCARSPQRWWPDAGAG